MKNYLSILFLILPQLLWASFLPKQFEAKMTQKYHSLRGSDRQDPIEMTYKFPGKLYFENKGEAPVTLVCNENKVWLYRPPFIEGEKGELKISNNQAYCHVRIFDALSKGLKDNSLYKVKKSGKTAVLTFVKAARNQLQVKQVTLNFKTQKQDSLADVASLIIEKVAGKETIKLHIQQFATPKSVNSKLFVFKSPKNTAVHHLD